MKLIHMLISSVFIPIYKFPFMYLTLTFSKGALTYSCSEYFVKSFDFFLSSKTIYILSPWIILLIYVRREFIMSMLTFALTQLSGVERHATPKL